MLNRHLKSVASTLIHYIDWPQWADRLQEVLKASAELSEGFVPIAFGVYSAVSRPRMTTEEFIGFWIDRKFTLSSWLAEGFSRSLTLTHTYKLCCADPAAVFLPGRHPAGRAGIIQPL